MRLSSRKNLQSVLLVVINLPLSNPATKALVNLTSPATQEQKFCKENSLQENLQIFTLILHWCILNVSIAKATLADQHMLGKHPSSL